MAEGPPIQEMARFCRMPHRQQELPGGLRMTPTDAVLGYEALGTRPGPTDSPATAPTPAVGGERTLRTVRISSTPSRMRRIMRRPTRRRARNESHHARTVAAPKP